MVRTILGLVLCAVGIVWLLQGIGTLKGSFMTGEAQWAVIGGVALVGGLFLLFRGRRRLS